MKKSDIFHKNNEMVKYIDGIYRKHDKCIGYCNNTCHKGFITKTLLKDHKCIERKCTFLDPIEDHLYWIYLMDKEGNKAKIKEKKRQKKNIEKLILEKARQISPEYVEVVMCKHLYDSMYLLIIIKSDFDITMPKEFLKDLGIRVYVKKIFEYQKENIQYTYKSFLPDNMRNKIK